MKTSLIALMGLLALTSASAFAENAVFKANAFTSQSQLQIKGIDGAIRKDFDQDGDKLNAIGGGAAFELRLEDPLRMGSGISYITYDGEDGKGGYSDFIWNVYAALDFVQTDVAALYGV